MADLVAALDYSGGIQGAWRYTDPGRLLATALGAPESVVATACEAGA